MVAVVLGQAISLFMLVVTLLYGAWSYSMGAGSLTLMSTLMLLPFVGTIIAGQNLRRGLSTEPQRRFLHEPFIGCALVSMLVSFAWFRDPMHDIALLFGSHGRWGCQTVNDDGSPVFVLRDSTVPFILFLPIVAATVGHWLANRGPS